LRGRLVSWTMSHEMNVRPDEDRLLDAEEQLRALADRCRVEKPPTRRAVEEALERGSARLIALEARLQKAQVGADSGDDRPEHRRVCDELAKRIGALRATVTEVRQGAASDDSSFLAAGFVLPADR
jgi:hypothetical protein